MIAVSPSNYVAMLHDLFVYCHDLRMLCYSAEGWFFWLSHLAPKLIPMPFLYTIQVNLQLLASCYLQNDQAYCAYHILKGRYILPIELYVLHLSVIGC